MKISNTLLQAIALGITVAVINTSCHRDEIKDGTKTAQKEKKEKVQKTRIDNCPACGMG